MEALEQRELMAGSLSASLDTLGVLRVEGTEAADTIVVSQANGSISVGGTGILNQGAIVPSVAASQVNRIDVLALGGDDTTSLSGVTVPGVVVGGGGYDILAGTSDLNSLLTNRFTGIEEARLAGNGIQKLVAANDKLYVLAGNRAVWESTESGWNQITAADIQTLVAAGDKVYWLNDAGAVGKYDNGTIEHITAADIQTLGSASGKVYWLNDGRRVAEYYRGSERFITGGDIQTFGTASGRVYWLNDGRRVAEYYRGAERFITGSDIQTFGTASGKVYWLIDGRRVAEYYRGSERFITGGDIRQLAAAGRKVYWLNDAGVVAEYDGAVRHITAAGDVVLSFNLDSAGNIYTLTQDGRALQNGIRFARVGRSNNRLVIQMESENANLRPPQDPWVDAMIRRTQREANAFVATTFKFYFTAASLVVGIARPAVITASMIATELLLDQTTNVNTAQAPGQVVLDFGSEGEHIWSSPRTNSIQEVYSQTPQGDGQAPSGGISFGFSFSTGTGGTSGGVSFGVQY